MTIEFIYNTYKYYIENNDNGPYYDLVKKLLGGYTIKEYKYLLDMFGSQNQLKLIKLIDFNYQKKDYYDLIIKLSCKYNHHNYYRYILKNTFYIINETSMIYILLTACQYGNIDILNTILYDELDYITIFKIYYKKFIKDKIILKIFKESNNLRVKRCLYSYKRNKKLKINLLSTVDNKKDIPYIRGITIYSNCYSDVNIICVN